MYNLSIIIPIYNAEKYLAKCLESVIKKYEDVEYILIDDGSTDKSELIYNRYLENKNVSIIKNENHGVSYTRNYGINISRGKYIMFVDADDYLKNDWYDIVIKEINDKYDLVVFSQKYDGIKYTKLDLEKSCLNCGQEALNKCKLMSPFSRIYKRDFLKKNNILFENKIINGEDMLFNFHVILLTDKIKIIDKGIYIYRINKNSATNTFNYEIFKSDYNFQLKLLSIVKNNEDYDKLKNCIYFCQINGIYIMLVRLSFSREKNKHNIIKEVIEEELYKEALSNYFKVDYKFSSLEKLIIKLIRKNKIKKALLLLTIKRNIKNIRFLNKNTIKLYEI